MLPKTNDVLLNQAEDGDPESLLQMPAHKVFYSQHLSAAETLNRTLDQMIKCASASTTAGNSCLGKGLRHNFIYSESEQRLETLVFQHHKPKFSARYADDTFGVIERDQMLAFKESLNAIFPNIQFTMEDEENNQLAFLDVFVRR
ncbi:unnamed protein product [Dibothriocephalus latus]|uniref:Reverse transcriptase domain-containing protein n=1 Tax=Dibothriocephalus latus TaxID=60516 RepID=A0A3P6TPB6_DIBLA|nr:unnamed protein product [Dibothriocephalus latus]